MWFTLLLTLALAVVVVYLIGRQRRIVRDHQWGLLYRDGRLARTLDAGAYWLQPLRDELEVVDRRSVTLIVGGQEVASADNIGVKASAVVIYQVVDAVLATRSVQDYQAELYARTQLVMRDEIAARTLDALLGTRRDLSESLTTTLAPAAEALGLRLHEVAVRDIMVANDLKRAYHEVVKARKGGEASLERARGETAALRNLANASRLLRDNPELLSLRALQAIESSRGNTFTLPDLRPPSGGDEPEEAS